MSKKFISQIINQNFIYPNNEVSEYDQEIVQDINDNSITGTLNSFSGVTLTYTGLTFTMNYTWNRNNGEPFIRNSSTVSLVSVHMLAPGQDYYQPWRCIHSTTSSDDSVSTVTESVTFSVSPYHMGLFTFPSGTYYFDVRFIGHRNVYPVCLTLPLTVIPEPTPTPTPTIGTDCYTYAVSNISGGSRTVTYTPCGGTSTSVSVPGGGDLNLGCVQENSVSGSVIIIQGEICIPSSGTPTPTPTSTPTPTPTEIPASYSIARVGACNPSQIETTYSITGQTGDTVVLRADFGGAFNASSAGSSATVTIGGTNTQSTSCFYSGTQYFSLSPTYTFTMPSTTTTFQTSAVTYEADETMTSLNVVIVSVNGVSNGATVNGCRGDSTGGPC